MEPWPRHDKLWTAAIDLRVTQGPRGEEEEEGEEEEGGEGRGGEAIYLSIQGDRHTQSPPAC